jgi:hypothetical protein
MGKEKGSTQKQKRRPPSVIHKRLPESLPTSVQKSYFMLTDAERHVLNIGLEKYRPGQSEPILIGGEKVIQVAPLPVWANFRQWALDVGIVEIAKKTDLKIEIESLQRSKHRRVTSVTFAIKEGAMPNR